MPSFPPRRTALWRGQRHRTAVGFVGRGLLGNRYRKELPTWKAACAPGAAPLRHSVPAEFHPSPPPGSALWAGLPRASPPRVASTLATLLRAKVELRSQEGAAAAAEPRRRGGERGGSGTGISHRDSQALWNAGARAAPCEVPWSALSSTAGGTAKAKAAGRLSLPVRSRPPSPLPWAEGMLGDFQQDGPPTPPQLPGSRSDKGVHLAQTDTGKMKPRRLPDHQAVPEGTASELSPSPSGPLSGYRAALARGAQNLGTGGRRPE